MLDASSFPPSVLGRRLLSQSGLTKIRWDAGTDDGTVAERCCYCGVRRGTQQTGSTGAGGLANTVTLITKSGQIVQNRTKSELPGLGFGPVLGLGLGPVVTLFMSQSRQLVAVSCELPRIV